MVAYQAVPTDVDCAFFAVAGVTEAGAIESIDVVDIAVRGGMAKVEEYVLRFAQDGLPIDLNRFAKTHWGAALEAAQRRLVRD